MANAPKAGGKGRLIKLLDFFLLLIGCEAFPYEAVDIRILGKGGNVAVLETQLTKSSRLTALPDGEVKRVCAPQGILAFDDGDRLAIQPLTIVLNGSRDIAYFQGYMKSFGHCRRCSVP
jgi:hypothetical protein